jgi:hypothetical protein
MASLLSSKKGFPYTSTWHMQAARSGHARRRPDDTLARNRISSGGETKATARDADVPVCRIRAIKMPEQSRRM